VNFQKFEHSIKGRILSDKEILNYYSVDSSFYQVRPKLVVIPKNISDIIKIVKFANTNKLSVTARGGGTGLVGSALNNGIILVLKDLNKIKVSKNHVEVESGVYKGKLDKILERHGKFLGPNPSVGPYCTIGGMIATNASGSHSLKYGSMIENLLSITFVTGKGKIVKLPSKTKIAHSILKLANSIDRKKFPKISKNSCGYRLDSISNQADSHKIIAASEGTLGVIVSAKLKTFKIPQKRSLFVIGYDSAKNAVNDCQNLVKLKPSALEFVDSNTMKNIKAKFPPKTRSLLFIEFDSKIHQSIAKLKKICNGKILRKLDNTESITKWWAYRNSALYFSLKNLLAGESLPHIIEDATVPLDKLNHLITLAEKIAKDFSARLVMYGHAGNGNIHIRLAAKKQDKATMQRLAKTFFSEIIKMNGTITGEHGDGLARTKFVKLQYGAKNYDIFLKLKREFDQNFVLNPNKIVTL
jgi:FAD/FMN-containing dehydrogenase